MALDGTQEITFDISGMSCKGCSGKVERALSETDGIITVTVSLDDANAVVQFDPAVLNAGQVVNIVTQKGYETVLSAPVEAVIDATETVKLDISGMTCASCSGRVEKALNGAVGVGAASVNLVLENATVRFDPSQTSAEAIAQVATDAGYAAVVKLPDTVSTVKMNIAGMTCSSCSGRVETALNGAEGVISANVNLVLENATINFDPAVTDVTKIAAVVAEAGYTATLQADIAPKDRFEKQLTRQKWELIAAIALSLPLLGQMVSMFTGYGYHLTPYQELALATPVQFIIGWRFYVGAWSAVRNAAGNMDLLVVMGTSAAFFYSLWRVIVLGHDAHGQLYFEAAAIVITLVLLGKYMESRAKRSASAALRQLMGLRPTTATLLVDGVEIDTPIDAVRVGDIALLRPGARVPVDGEIISGDSELDESLITGESMPVARHVGDAVIAGSINGGGVLQIKTLKVGADTTLARVANMVEEAQVGKAPIQKLVDRVSAIFVPVIIVLALLTFAGWMISGASAETALVATISVLVIACPCALGLATPTALVAGTGAGARAGILIRDIETLERARGIDIVVFDKTGTLTMGKPKVVEIVSFSGSDDELLAIAAQVQSGSEHPLGKAVIAAARERELTVAKPGQTRATAGEGIEAAVDGVAFRMGRLRFVSDDITAAQQAQADKMRAGGRTVVGLGKAGKLLGLVALADTIRPESAAAVAQLHKRGIKTVLMTGDNAETAAVVATLAGIDQVIADMRPEDKAAEIAKLSKLGHPVAMVGDGVNDAPALALADLGIAMGGGADVAVETAGFVLMRPDPRLVAAALDVARVTGTKIRQNLFWAFAYNVVCIPIAAAGLLNPALAGGAMAFSSVFVVGNSLLLKRWKPEA
ncbi:MAG: heavy metal translocating P-type ATPase [Rhodobacteraceae bacterium]|nr:heavy metal translocating P-type ATPase [Paracoccaceae bacterium]